jgi:hypothetical protein
MDKLSIYTNYHARQFSYRSEVPPDILASEFDWCAAEDSFFCYRGRWYHLDEFMRIDQTSPLQGHWDGYLSDSFFSGVLIKLLDNGDGYQIGTYIC